MTNKNERPWISVIFGESPMQPEYVAVGNQDLYVQLKSTDVQTLLVLAHHAEHLADPARPAAEEEFQSLCTERLVTADQRGQLVAVITLSQLADETGLVRSTVRLSLRRLEARGLIQTFSLVRHWNLDTGRLARDTLVTFSPRYVVELTADEWEVVGARSPR